MFSLRRSGAAVFTAVGVLLFVFSGCTSPREFIQNRFKVGPDYCRPPAPVAEHWIDVNDTRLTNEENDLEHWWAVFKDPVLNSLVVSAYGQNLTVGQAGFRVLQARAQLGIAQGYLFPQMQDMTGSYTRSARSLLANPSFGGLGGIGRYTSSWAYGFNLGWELDFWGRFRRAVESADDQLSASVEDYDAALVTMLGDIAASYVQIRIDEERIELLRANAKLQSEILRIVQARFDAGRVSELDVDQAKSTLAQTEAAIPLLEIDRRQAANRLCVLLAIPPQDLDERLGKAAIPTPPYQVAAGIPAQLLARRPDIRRMERLAAAQSEQIGIAEADFYPAISISGTLGYQAAQFGNLFDNRAFTGNVGPSFQWNILNYGRILNNVQLQDARFQELVMAYQQSVLSAAREVEDGLVTFLRAQERTKLLEESVLNTEKAVKVVIAQYQVGTADFTRVAQIEQELVTQQDLLAQARGQIAQGLILVYRALGGGWQIRLESEEELNASAQGPAPAGTPAPHGPQLFEAPGTLPQPGAMPAQPGAPPAANPANPPAAKPANPPAAKAGEPAGTATISSSDRRAATSPSGQPASRGVAAPGVGNASETPREAKAWTRKVE